MIARYLAALLPLALLRRLQRRVGRGEGPRFPFPDPARRGRGAVTVVPGAGMDAASLEYRPYATAVARQLALLGYAEQVAGTAPQRAEVRLKREVWREGASRSPVSVGVGGSTGSYGSGIGVGIGLNLSGPPPEQVTTELSVTIRETASGRALWEGRASFTVRATSPMAQTPLGAARLAEALFKDFPGRSGETVLVK